MASYLAVKAAKNEERTPRQVVLSPIKYVLICVTCCAVALCYGAVQGAKPRVFITDSTSWEVTGSAVGSSGGIFSSSTRGGARPQTAEIIKTFGERCQHVVINNKQEKADYIVVLDHEGGKGVFLRKNKVAVFNKDGDAIISRSTRSLGNSVQDACEAIAKDWTDHSGTSAASTPAESSVAPITGPLSPHNNPTKQKTPSLTKPAEAQPEQEKGIVEQNEGGYLGASSNENPRIRRNGVLLSAVVIDGPAYQAGLQAGDVILSVDGHYVYTVDGLSAEVGKHRPGERIAIKYVRGVTTFDTYAILSGQRKF